MMQFIIMTHHLKANFKGRENLHVSKFEPDYISGFDLHSLTPTPKRQFVPSLHEF